MGKAYIFLDEVQYSPDWVQAVKRFYDLYPNLKFYLSGSSTLLLSKDALSGLAGRFFFVDVFRVTFREFLGLKGINVKEVSSILQAHFSDYLIKAGFPEIVGWENLKQVKEYIRNSAIDRIVLKDLPFLFGQRDPVAANRIISYLMSNPGCLVNLDNLSRDFGISRITLSRYLFQLESALALRSLANFRPSSMSSSRKLKRYYPVTTSLAYTFSDGLFGADRSRILETYVVNAVKARNFYRRGNKEIDAVVAGKEVVAFEAKESCD